MRSARTPTATRRVGARPGHYAGLLLHPINDSADPTLPWLPNWELEHGPHRRFVLGGGIRFLNNAGLSANRVAQYRQDAVELLYRLQDKGAIDWRAMPGMQSDPSKFWSEISRQQVNRAFNGEALFLSKIMVILLMCELAVADLLRRKTKFYSATPINAPEEIYEVMSAIPACWNINKFNVNSLASVEADDPTFLEWASRACGQRDDGDCLRELARGHTVTYKTAHALHGYLIESGIVLDPTTAPTVRAKSGKYLGTKPAAPSELIDRG